MSCQNPSDVRHYPCRDLLQDLNGFKSEDRHPFISAGSTAVELGHPSGISVCAAMATRDRGLLSQSRVTLVGRELGELSTGRHGIALVVVVQSHDDLHRARQVILKRLSLFNRFKGCMARISAGRIWLRFSFEAIDMGLTLSRLGAYLIAQIKRQCKGVEHVEVIWAIGDSRQTRDIKGIVQRRTAEKSLRLTRELAQKMSCDTGLSCEECPENDTCQVLKDAVALTEETS